jgi:hypothetical protein
MRAFTQATGPESKELFAKIEELLSGPNERRHWRWIWQ